MILWTIQPVEWYEKLKQDAVIYGDPTLSALYSDKESDNFHVAYDWMALQMEKRIGKRPFDNALPVWAWYRYEKKKPKPDLRYSGYLKRGEYGVRLEIEKDDNDVLLSDFMLWMHPLGKYYIPLSEEDDLEFNNVLDPFLEENNLRFGDFDKYPKSIQEKIIKSWELVFDLDFADEYVASKREDKALQATFWSLHINEVRDITFFRAR